MRDDEARMIAVRPVSAKHIHRVLVLKCLYVRDVGLHNLPQCLDVPFKRFAWRQRWLEVPGIIPMCRGSRSASLAFNVHIGRLHTKPRGQLVERKILAADAQSSAVIEIRWRVGFFPTQETPQGAKPL